MMNHQRWKCYHSYLSQPQWHSTPAQKRMSWAGHDIFHSETKISRHHVILKTWPSRQKAETVQFLKIKSSCTHFISTLSVAQWFLIVTGVNNSKHQSRVFTWQCQRVSSAQEVHLYEFMYIHIYIYTQVWYGHSPNWASSWLIWMPRTQGSKISCIHPNQILILYAAIILQCLSFEGPINMKWLPWHAENLVPRPMLDRWNEIHGFKPWLASRQYLTRVECQEFLKRAGTLHQLLFIYFSYYFWVAYPIFFASTGAASLLSDRCYASSAYASTYPRSVGV